MIATIQSTTQIVDLVDPDNGGRVRTRVYEGTCANGRKVYFFVQRVACPMHERDEVFAAQMAQNAEPTVDMATAQLFVTL